MYSNRRKSLQSSTFDYKSEFSLKLVVCDYYLAKPVPELDVVYSEFRGTDVKQVPILRIFGPAIDGLKACLHVHGVFPYFYIPCPVTDPPPQFLYQIAASLDKAINIALKQANSTSHHVYKITLVKGLPFYGYHDKDHLYLKVFLYSPGLITKAVELCSNGAILGQMLQPHESHLNFTLQFFIDFNLFGMSSVDLQSVKFRKSLTSKIINDDVHINDLKKESICHYEADCVASHIINRQRIGKGDGIENPGLEEVWNQEIKRRHELNMSIASKSLSQDRLPKKETDSHYKYQQLIERKLSNPVSVLAEPNKVLVHYPAESVEDCQLFNATDVSLHLSVNTSSFPNKDDNLMTLQEESSYNTTIVDEDVALSSSLSLHHSQVLLNSEDIDLLDMLNDMDKEQMEEDSVLATQAINTEVDTELADAEYSQIFHEDVEGTHKSLESEDNSLNWNDSFWDNANIPQIDGTYDDDHLKKVKKRKIRPLKLGLSRPKSKNQEIPNPNTSDADCDEINISRDESLISISPAQLKSNVKKEVSSALERQGTDTVFKTEVSFKSINKEFIKTENVTIANRYDLQKQYQPTAGPSKFNYVNNNNVNLYKYGEGDVNNFDTSSPEDNDLGIMSFYNMSKLFDTSVEDCKMLENIVSVSNEITKNITRETQEDTDANVSKNLIEVKVHNGCKIVLLSPKIKPPTKLHIVLSLRKYNIPLVKNLQPYYSACKDVGEKVEIGSIVLKLHSNSSKDQKSFEKVLNTRSIEEWRQLTFIQTNAINDDTSKPEMLKPLLAGNKQYILEPVKRPPTCRDIVKWLSTKTLRPVQQDKVELLDHKLCENIEELDNSQALGLIDNHMDVSLSLEKPDNENTNSHLQVTLQSDGSFLCFGNSESQQRYPSESPSVEVSFITLMVLEVHTSIREQFHPDPSKDSVKAIFYTVTNDCPSEHFLSKSITEIIVVDNSEGACKYLDRCVFNQNISYVNTENDLFDKLIQIVQQQDPDIMCAYENETTSWGYIMERAQVLGMEISRELSRITDKQRQKLWRNENNEFEGKIIGRIMFSVWRIFRHEMALSSYSFENCMFEIMKERVPKYDYAQLSKWWNDESRISRWIPVEYYLTRLSGTVRMLDKLDIINRTSELARLFGLQWWEVLSRGSQFRVESLMLRAARPLNLVALSPTVKQRAGMRAPEILPLIFEPESRFYADPVIVLDFQSLYPSMMIAYNYCFSTCIGRVENINGESAYEFGAWRLRIPKSKLETLIKNNLVHWSPVGVGFVKPTVRRGVLPVLLRRILAARQAVKKSMKLQTDETVKKTMHSRQLGLKLIANVTYGYTAANFSGRMPCVEVGDSVVAKGRETLERAINLVRQNKQWNVKVVYGDTDSMFVLVPGGTREEAFRIGQEIADAVTADNPSPVALKLEKVYQPCILQTKKRYVGYMYESLNQEKPIYEAKGIETVRRDGCLAGVMLLRDCLCELFDTGDMSRVKSIVISTLTKLVENTIPPQDLFFTREYHGPNGYKPGASAPPNEIAKEMMRRDRRSVPAVGWRLSWQVVCGGPHAALVSLARPPERLLRCPEPPHVAYYATRVLLPPLQRCLSLLGVDVFQWWRQVGRLRGTHWVGGSLARYVQLDGIRRTGGSLARYGHLEGIQRTGGSLTRYVRHDGCAARALSARTQICMSCCGHTEADLCVNTECPVLWRGVTIQRTLANLQDISPNIALPENASIINF